MQISKFRYNFAIPKRKTNVFEQTATAVAVKTKDYEKECLQTFCSGCKTALPEGDSQTGYKVLPYFAAKAIVKKVRRDWQRYKLAGRPHYSPEGEHSTGTCYLLQRWKRQRVKTEEGKKAKVDGKIAVQNRKGKRKVKPLVRV